MDSPPEPDVLVIEDVRVFNFPCVYARTVGEAWQLLFSRPWREVWFDYDMGNIRSDVNSYPLAVQLERLAHDGMPHPIDRVYVHSANPYGGDRLMAALRAYSPVRVDANRYLAPGQEPMLYAWPDELAP